MSRSIVQVVFMWVGWAVIVPLSSAQQAQVSSQLAKTQAYDGPLVLAHYMPWYMAKPFSQAWGWHWTMNHFDPGGEKGPTTLASHLNPIIGAYDSGDPAVLEYHLLTMKIAGIQGVIVDWYGLTDFRDYALLHANTIKLIKVAEELQMKFAICYEDQTIPALVEAGKLRADQRVSHARKELEWLAQNWFVKSNYVRVDDRPVLLSFGQTGLNDQEWTDCLNQAKHQLSYFSLHHRRSAAIGAFDWPIPSEGLAAQDRFYQKNSSSKQSIPVVFPRFIDIYQQAGVGKSYGRVDDDEGSTFKRSLEQAVSSRSQIIQLATWNDWGEGTSIEPSLEFGFRDLEWLQATFRERIAKQSMAPSSQQAKSTQQASQLGSAEDIELPLMLYRRRMASRPQSNEARQLDQISAWLAKGEYARARKQLDNGQ